LDVDFLALLAQRAAASGVVGAAPQRAPVEAVLELAVVLGFPLFDRHAELLLNPVPVPLRDNVERAEGNDSEVGREVVDVASLETLLVLIVFEAADVFLYLLRRAPSICLGQS
jgi:hypothetical protein